MGRFIQYVPGTVKSVQHISGSGPGNNSTTNVTISAVASTTSAYIIRNASARGNLGYQSHGAKRMWGWSTPPSMELTSTTNVQLVMPNLQSGYVNAGSYNADGYRATIVEIHDV